MDSKNLTSRLSNSKKDNTGINFEKNEKTKILYSLSVGAF